MKEHSILVTDKHLEGLNPVLCGWQKCEASHAFGPAVRSYYLLHYVLSGSGTFTSGGQTHHLQQGDIFVIRPEESTFYCADAHTPWHYIWAGFHCNAQLAALLRQNVLTLPAAGPLFSSMVAASSMVNGRELYICSKLYELLALIEAQENHPATKDDAIRRALTLLDNEYMKDISISQLAEKLNLDRSYFSVLFKRGTGLSPQNYLTNLRLTRATELMQQKGFSVSEAAIAVGYTDVYVFSRIFKQNRGVSPRAYLQACTAPRHKEL